MPAVRLWALGLTGVLALAFPVAWFAPLMTVKVRLAFWASGTEISLVSTLQALWAEDAALALVLSFLTLLYLGSARLTPSPTPARVSDGVVRDV